MICTVCQLLYRKKFERTEKIYSFFSSSLGISSIFGACFICRLCLHNSINRKNTTATSAQPIAQPQPSQAPRGINAAIHNADKIVKVICKNKSIKTPYQSNMCSLYNNIYCNTRARECQRFFATIKREIYTGQVFCRRSDCFLRIYPCQKLTKKRKIWKK